MTCRYAVKTVAHAEVKAHRSLRLRRLFASDGQAEGSGNGVNNVLEVVVVVDGSQQLRASKEFDIGFAECYVDVMDAALLKETEDVFGGLVRDVAGGGVLLDSDPDSDGTDDLAHAAIRIRIVPTEADEIDRGEGDKSLVEEFANLETNVSPQNAALLDNHVPCHEQWPTGCPCPIGRGRRLEGA